MAIIGIEGGIGSGKTLLLATLGYGDLQKGRTIISNIAFKGLSKEYRSRVKYLTADTIANMLTLIKNKELTLTNTTILIQEAHNYVDSRNSMSTKNKTFSYWILQSRHSGQNSCDIIFDTQSLSQVDLRLRRNTDYVFHPYITEWEHFKNGKKAPNKILAIGHGKIYQQDTRFTISFDVSHTRNIYDTHEMVDF